MSVQPCQVLGLPGRILVGLSGVAVAALCGAVAGGLILTVLIQVVFWTFVFAANRPALPPTQLAALQISKAYVAPVPGLEPEPIERSGRTLKRLPFNTRETDASPCVRGARFSAYQLSADVSLADPDVVYGVHVSGIRDNYAVWLNGRMVATPRGRPVLDGVLRALLV